MAEKQSLRHFPRADFLPCLLLRCCLLPWISRLAFEAEARAESREIARASFIGGGDSRCVLERSFHRASDPSEGDRA